ncbi:MAG: hypothetical protein JXL84_24675 [Deltaproteobacteria bacterium]|nr:hypothetical protein [Deltaproteobacteria bacterium]
MRRTGWPIFPLGQYFEGGQGLPAFFILRHDVDRRPGRALEMAAVEESFGVRSTFYFRVNRDVFNMDIIRSIAAMNHEIGYHSEVLHKARGRIDSAERIFWYELSRLRSLAEVRTASMHGNPLSRWDNRDFWKYFTPSRFGLSGEAYGSVKDPCIFYLTDTGRGWNRWAFNARDRFPEGSVRLMPALASTAQLIRTLREGAYKKVYLQVHPNRWTSGTMQWHCQWVEDLLLNAVKWFLMRVRRGTYQP